MKKPLKTSKTTDMFFYPGSLWAKRIQHLIVLCGIGANLVINDVQNQMLAIGEDMIKQASMLSNPATSTAYVLEHSIVPAISYMENTRFSGVIQRFGIPSSNDLKGQIKNAYDLKQSLALYGPRYKDFALILQVINIVFWISIGISGLWILIDLIKGKQQFFIIVALVISTGINILCYNYLSGFFSV